MLNTFIKGYNLERGQRGEAKLIPWQSDIFHTKYDLVQQQLENTSSSEDLLSSDVKKEYIHLLIINSYSE